MAQVINVHAAVRGGTQWSTRRGRCLGPRLKTTLQLLSSPLFLSLGPDERCGRHAGPKWDICFSSGLFLFPGAQSHEKYQLCLEERPSHHFCRVGAGRQHLSATPDGPKGGRRIGIYLRILPMRVFGRLNWELVDEREPGEEELG